METELSVGRVRVFVAVNDDEATINPTELMTLVSEFHAKVVSQVVEDSPKRIGFGNGS